MRDVKQNWFPQAFLTLTDWKMEKTNKGHIKHVGKNHDIDE